MGSVGVVSRWSPLSVDRSTRQSVDSVWPTGEVVPYMHYIQSASKLLRLSLISFRVDFKLGAQMALSPASPGQCCVVLFSTSLADSSTTLIRVGEDGVSRKRTFWTSFLCKQ